MSGIENTLSNMSDRLENLENNVEENKEKEIPNRGNKIFGTLFSIIILLLFLWYDLFSYFFELHIYLTNFLGFFPSLFNFKSPSWTTFILLFSGYISFLVYYNIIIFLIIGNIFFGAYESRKSFSNQWRVWQVKILLLFLTGYVLSIALAAEGTDSETRLEEFKTDWFGNDETTQKTIWEKWAEEISCRTDVSCILKKEDQNEAVLSKNTAYSISLSGKTPASYKSTDLSVVPIPYEIQANGDGIILNKLECYHNSKSEENLIYTQDLNSKLIQSKSKIIIAELQCDLSSLKSEENYGEVIKVYPVLYYTIETDYTQTLTFVDYEQFSQKFSSELGYQIRDAAREKYPKPDGEVGSEILQVISTIPVNFPILLGDEEYIKSFIFSADIKSETTTLGKATRIKILEIIYPQTYLTLTSEQSLPMELSTTKEGDSSINLPFEISHQNSDLEIEGIQESVKIIVEAQMKLDRESFEFILKE